MSDFARCAVLGHPVAHSLSPRIHDGFAHELGMVLEYEKVDVEPESLSSWVKTFFADGGIGLNITLPHKQAAAALAAQSSDAVVQADAANVLSHGADGAIVADNFDGVALIRDLTERYRLDLRGHDTLLLGAGGAGRAAAFALIDAGVRSLTIVNRSSTAADALADALGQPGRVHNRYWNDLGSLGVFDLVINATSAGVLGQQLGLPFGLLTPRATCYDLCYGSAASEFLGWAKASDARYAYDGLGMLIEGSAQAFERWFGKRADTEQVFAELRAEFPLGG